MKTQKVLPILIVGIMLLSACKPSPKEANAKPSTATNATSSTEGEPRSEKVYHVKTAKLGIEKLQRSMDYTATFSAYEEVHFAPASPGRIDKIFVELGNRVVKGQVIAEMDKTQLKQAKIQLDNATINLGRMQQLKETNSISQQQVDQVQMAYDVAKANVDFLEENTTLLSPISGIVTGKYYENGEMFSGAPNTQAGKAAIVSLMQIKPLKAIVNVSESNYPQISLGMQARINSDIYPDKVFAGKVYRIHPTINPGTRTFQVEVVTPNSDEKLRPGMYSSVQLELDNYEAIAVPSYAVLQQEGTNNRYVFINKNGIAKRVNVTIGKRLNEKIEIISDALAIGDDLIVVGQANLMDNFKITVVK